MKPTNFIPRPRLDARRRAARVRLWVSLGAAYALLLSVGYGVLAASWRYDRTGLEQAVETATSANVTARATLASLTAEATAMQRRLTANRAVGDQPDWSILLALLAGRTGDEIVLKRCQLAPVSQMQATSARRRGERNGDGAGALMLRLEGFAATQAAVTRLAIRLEEVGLFRRVELVQSRRETFRGGEAVAFEIECLLPDEGASP